MKLVGKKFTVKDDVLDGYTYTIKESDEEGVYLACWIEDGEEESVKYALRNVEEYIEEGYWILENE